MAIRPCKSVLQGLKPCEGDEDDVGAAAIGLREKRAFEKISPAGVRWLAKPCRYLFSARPMPQQERGASQSHRPARCTYPSESVDQDISRKATDIAK